MRLTSTAKYFIGFLLATAAIVFLVLYLASAQPGLTGIAVGILLIAFAGFILYISGTQLLGYLRERADNILAVCPDASGKALHIFSSFSSPGGRLATTSMRSIQYYCVLTDTHQSFYTVLFSHPVKALSGRSGYEGFPSFEEAVLQSDRYKNVLASYSAKAGFQLQPTAASPAGKEQDHATKLGTGMYRVLTSKTMVSNNLQLCCFDEAGGLLWKKKL